jgi:NAD(P)H dehydrogenase (quinone)
VRVLLVVDHPYAGAFTHALAAAAQRGLATAGHEVDLVDLHADRFDPVMHAADLAAWRIGQNTDPQVDDYQERLVAADYLVLAFPIWWELMPAMTKGFIDKVVAKDVAYTQPKPGGLMKGRLDRLQGVSMLTVMATPDIAYRLVFGNPITKAVFRGTFKKIGTKHLTWTNHSNPAGKTPEQREVMLQAIESRFVRLISQTPPATPGSSPRPLLTSGCRHNAASWRPASSRAGARPAAQ